MLSDGFLPLQTKTCKGYKFYVHEQHGVYVPLQKDDDNGNGMGAKHAIQKVSRVSTNPDNYASATEKPRACKPEHI